jgi:hypothetical protein
VSATNRGASRRPQDFYETPVWLTEAIIPILQEHLFPIEDPRILEPAAGQGAILQVLEDAFPHAVIHSGDITTGQDFLTYPYDRYYDLIITNPPYSLALEFIQRAMEFRHSHHHNHHPIICMLLRVNFLGAQKRARWLREHTPSIYVSPRRPDFTGGGGDATEYAWFVWDPRRRGRFAIPTVGILETECDSGQPLRALGCP